VLIRKDTQTRFPIRLVSASGSGVTGVTPAMISDGTSTARVTWVKGDGSITAVTLVQNTNFFEVSATKCPGLYHIVLPSFLTNIAGHCQLAAFPAATQFLGSVYTGTIDIIYTGSPLRIPVRLVSITGAGVAAVTPPGLTDGTTVGNVTLVKADGTFASIALTANVNWFEISATKAPGLYHVLVPASALSVLGNTDLFILPTGAAFIQQDIRSEINQIGFDSSGSGQPAIIQLTRVIDARTIEIVFDRPVIEAQATIAANYFIALDEGVVQILPVSKATKITDFHYEIICSRQVMDTPYEVTVSNVNGQSPPLG